MEPEIRSADDTFWDTLLVLSLGATDEQLETRPAGLLRDAAPLAQKPLRLDRVGEAG